LAVIKREVQAFTVNHGFRVLAREDLENECYIAWLFQRPRFDPARGLIETFLKRVVRSRLLDLLKVEMAESRRGEHRAESLDLPVGDGSPLSYEDRLAADGDLSADATFRLDHERALARLGKRERVVAELVAEGYSRADVAEMLAVSRDTVQEDLKRIRRVFRDEGLAPKQSE
jgi:RNA polymerase sigma factor (sigma-70 family)